MKLFFKINVLCLLIITILYSCSSLKKGKNINDKIVETEVERDASVPVGYVPNIITGLEKFRTDTSIHYQMRILNTMHLGGKLRIDFNIGDNKGRLYLQANAEKWKKSWCSIEEKSEEKSVPIKRYILHHTSELENVPANYAFVLDQSASMGEMRVFTAQNAIANLVSNDKKPEDAFAIIKYDSKPYLEVPLTSDPDKFMQLFKFSTIQDAGGNSSINDAFDLAIDALTADSSKKEKVLIIFTDGVENSSKKAQTEIAKNAKTKGIKVSTIDFGTNTDAQYMSTLATLTGGSYDHIYKTNEFNTIFSALYKRNKNKYTLEYIPSLFGLIRLKIVLCNGIKKCEVLTSFNNEIAPGNSIGVNIQYDLNKSTLKTTYLAEIERIAGIIKSTPNHKFEIRVHTDETSDSKSSLNLSQKRADGLKSELVKKGVDKNKIVARGMGRSMLFTDSKSKDVKLLNRRVELWVTE